VREVHLDLAGPVLGVDRLDRGEVPQRLDDGRQAWFECVGGVEGVAVHPVVDRTPLGVQQVELQFQGHLGGVAPLGELVDDVPEDGAWVCGQRLAVVGGDVGQHVTDAVAPGQPAKRPQVGPGDRVRVAGRPVGEADAFLDLGRGVPGEGPVAEGDA
jgi:hypothetical protein